MKHFLSALVFRRSPKPAKAGRPPRDTIKAAEPQWPVTASPPSCTDSCAGWATATSVQKSTGRTLFFRYIRDFTPQFQRSDYADRVAIVWQYESPTGMPQMPDRDHMDRLEDLLSSSLEAASLATLVLVSTGENMREWIYYTRSEADFMAQLNTALDPQKPFPIEVHAAPDPDWKSYEDFLAAVRC